MNEVFFLTCQFFLHQSSLRDQVMKTRFWPVEVMRTSVPTGVKGKKSVSRKIYVNNKTISSI